MVSIDLSACQRCNYSLPLSSAWAVYIFEESRPSFCLSEGSQLFLVKPDKVKYQGHSISIQLKFPNKIRKKAEKGGRKAVSERFLQMKPAKSITFLLLLLLLFITAQGIRLNRELIAETSAVRAQVIRKERSSMENRLYGSSHGRHALNCRGSSCSGSRRLLVNTLPSAQLVSLGAKEEKKGKQAVTSLDHDVPDLMDIAGMDYSSARKSSPNHN